MPWYTIPLLTVVCSAIYMVIDSVSNPYDFNATGEIVFSSSLLISLGIIIGHFL